MPTDRAELRFPVQKQGRYRTGNGIARDVMVTDLSTKGCKLFDKFSSLSAGNYLTIRVGSVGPLEAEVRWVEASTVGIKFRKPLHQSVLDHMRNTIEGWHIPSQQTEESSPPRKQNAPSAPPNVEGEPAIFRLNVRPATVADVRSALLDAGFSLPISSHTDLVEVFHRVLDKVAVET